MSEAAQRGVHVGRPRGGEAPDAFLEKYPRVVELLGKGKSIRAAARETGVAINTVRKVAAALEQRQQGGSRSPPGQTIVAGHCADARARAALKRVYGRLYISGRCWGGNAPRNALGQWTQGRSGSAG